MEIVTLKIDEAKKRQLLKQTPSTPTANQQISFDEGESKPQQSSSIFKKGFSSLKSVFSKGN